METQNCQLPRTGKITSAQKGDLSVFWAVPVFDLFFFFPLSCFQKLPCVCVYVCVRANFLRTSFLFQPIHPLSDYLVFPFSAPLLHCILSKWTCCAVQEQRNISCSLISPFFCLPHSFKVACCSFFVFSKRKRKQKWVGKEQRSTCVRCPRSNGFSLISRCFSGLEPACRKTLSYCFFFCAVFFFFLTFTVARRRWSVASRLWDVCEGVEQQYTQKKKECFFFFFTANARLGRCKRNSLSRQREAGPFFFLDFE